MKVLYLTIAILALLSSTESITRKDLKCAQATDFRKLSHCITKRQACDSCNDATCNNCGSCDSCNDDDYYPRGNRNSDTSSNNQNRVNIENSQRNENPHQNKIQVNLLNTVHNLNKINTPIEVNNQNHFFYDERTATKMNVQRGSSYIPEVTEAIKEGRNPCCGNGNCGIRPPMLLPPYLSSPPPCHYMPQMPFYSCGTSPAPYIVPSKKLFCNTSGGTASSILGGG